MDTLIVDPRFSERLIEERRERGADRFDEVWEGVYIMAPLPDDEHQEIATYLSRPFLEVVKDTGSGVVRLGTNLASDPVDWRHDYRVPDVAVFLAGSAAECHGAFWTGPPDFLVEITSPWDKTRKKLGFYGKIAARELLVIDRDPWQLELYRRQGDKLILAAKLVPGEASAIQSAVLPIQFRLLPGSARPTIEVVATDLQRTWNI
jgi:Uma2 family endonuclease